MVQWLLHFTYMSEHSGLVGSIPSGAVHFLSMSIQPQHVTTCPWWDMPSDTHVTEFYELVCVLLLLTKVSHACGWHFVPAYWAGCAKLRFMVDIITLGMTRNSTRIRRNQLSRVVRSLRQAKNAQVTASNVTFCRCTICYYADLRNFWFRSQLRFPLG